MNFVEELALQWRTRGFASEPSGVTDETVTSFERRFSIQMPADIRVYFKMLNGMSKPSHDTDETGFRFLPLSEVLPLGEFVNKMQWRGRNYLAGLETAFVFVDYLQWCYAYAFETSSTNHGAILRIDGADEPRVVAASFSRFVQLYLIDDMSLHRP